MFRKREFVTVKLGTHYTTLYNQPTNVTGNIQLTTNWRTLYNSTVELFIHPIFYNVSTYTYIDTTSFSSTPLSSQSLSCALIGAIVHRE